MTGLRLLLCSRGGRSGQTLAGALAEAPEVARVETAPPGELETALAGVRFDALCLELGADPRADLERLERLPVPRPALLLAGSGDDPALIVRAMRLRPEAFLIDGRLHELPAALERIHRSRRHTRGARGVVALSGAKGGVGTTLLACELARWLARGGGRTCLVDLDLHRGAVALYMDLCPLHTLVDLARKGDALDADYLRGAAVLHESGVHVLAAPHELEEAQLFGATPLERTLALLRREFDWVVLDVAGAWDEVALRALDLSDLVLLVSSLDIASLTHASSRRKRLTARTASEGCVRVVVRRTGGQLGLADVARALGRAPDLQLPCDAATAQTACNRGISVHQLSPGGALDQANRALASSAHRWLGLPEPALSRAAQRTGPLSSRLARVRNSLRLPQAPGLLPPRSREGC